MDQHDPTVPTKKTMRSMSCSDLRSADPQVLRVLNAGVKQESFFEKLEKQQRESVTRKLRQLQVSSSGSGVTNSSPDSHAIGKPIELPIIVTSPALTLLKTSEHSVRRVTYQPVIPPSSSGKSRPLPRAFSLTSISEPDNKEGSRDNNSYYDAIVRRRNWSSSKYTSNISGGSSPGSQTNGFQRNSTNSTEDIFNEELEDNQELNEKFGGGENTFTNNYKDQLETIGTFHEEVEDDAFETSTDNHDKSFASSLTVHEEDSTRNSTTFEIPLAQKAEDYHHKDNLGVPAEQFDNRKTNSEQTLPVNTVLAVEYNVDDTAVSNSVTSISEVLGESQNALLKENYSNLTVSNDNSVTFLSIDDHVISRLENLDDQVSYTNGNYNIHVHPENFNTNEQTVTETNSEKHWFSDSGFDMNDNVPFDKTPTPNKETELVENLDEYLLISEKKPITHILTDLKGKFTNSGIFEEFQENATIVQLPNNKEIDLEVVNSAKSIVLNETKSESTLSNILANSDAGQNTSEETFSERGIVIEGDQCLVQSQNVNLSEEITSGSLEKLSEGVGTYVEKGFDDVEHSMHNECALHARTPEVTNDRELYEVHSNAQSNENINEEYPSKTEVQEAQLHTECCLQSDHVVRLIYEETHTKCQFPSFHETNEEVHVVPMFVNVNENSTNQLDKTTEHEVQESQVHTECCLQSDHVVRLIYEEMHTKCQFPSFHDTNEEVVPMFDNVNENSSLQHTNQLDKTTEQTADNKPLPTFDSQDSSSQMVSENASNGHIKMSVEMISDGQENGLMKLTDDVRIFADDTSTELENTLNVVTSLETPQCPSWYMVDVEVENGIEGLGIVIDGGTESGTPINIKQIFTVPTYTRKLFEVGDIITNINGCDWTSIDVTTAINQLKALPCGPIKLQLRRNAKPPLAATNKVLIGQTVSDWIK